MKRVISTLAFVMLALVISSGAAKAATFEWTDFVTLESLLDNGSIAIGDKIFSDFGYGSAGNLTAAQINVRAGMDLDNGIYFLQFQGAFTAGPGQTNDYGLFYSVESTGPGIDGIDQSFNLSGGDGEIQIGESVFDNEGFGNLVAQSTVEYNGSFTDQNDPEGEAFQGDDLIIDPALAKVYVTKDILVIGGKDRVTASIITQSFHQPIPEPGSLMLLGSGLLGLGILLRKRVK